MIHSHPELWQLRAYLLRAPTLLTFKWWAFQQWCIPISVLFFEVLTLFQEMLDKGLSFSMTKVCLAAMLVMLAFLAWHQALSYFPFSHGLWLSPVSPLGIWHWCLRLIVAPHLSLLSLWILIFFHIRLHYCFVLHKAGGRPSYFLSMHPLCTHFTLDGPNAANSSKVIPAAHRSMAFELLMFFSPHLWHWIMGTDIEWHTHTHT